MKGVLDVGRCHGKNQKWGVDRTCRVGVKDSVILNKVVRKLSQRLQQ